MQTILQNFSGYFNKIRFEDVPLAVINQAKLLTIDLIGVSIPGSQMSFSRMIRGYLTTIGGCPESTLFGTYNKIPRCLAALGNGVIAHALDMDDGYRYGGVHAGVTVIPSALSSAEANNRDGKSFLLAIICGYEIVSRISRAINPSHLKRGFHTTGTIGVFGATTAAGILSGLNENEMLSAMGMAGMQAAGLLEILNDGGMTKPLQAGKACMAGVLSVELAKRGAKGPSNILEGNKGLFMAMTDEVDTASISIDLGKHYCILDQYIKFHASCRHTHPAIDGLLTLIKNNRLKFDDIKNVKIETYQTAINFCGKCSFPETVEDAKFSLSYSIAMAAYFGDLNNDHFNQDSLKNLKIRSLASRVEVLLDKKWEKLYPAERGATVIVKTGHNIFKIEVPLAKGEPENPPTIDEIVSKFNKNLNSVGITSTDQLLDTLLNLDKIQVKDLTNMLRQLIGDQC